jgi:hypothetical protein
VNDLVSTVKGMLSGDYKERLDAEIQQANIRLYKLMDHVEANEGLTDLTLEEKQIDIMAEYIGVLMQRKRKINGQM